MSTPPTHRDSHGEGAEGCGTGKIECYPASGGVEMTDEPPEHDPNGVTDLFKRLWMPREDE